MPNIKIKNETKGNVIFLKCNKISEKVGYKMNISDLPNKMTLIVDILERKSTFAIEGFFVDEEGGKTAYQSKNDVKKTLIGWEGDDTIKMYNKTEEEAETDETATPGVVTNFTTSYIEGENYFKFTMEYVEKLS